MKKPQPPPPPPQAKQPRQRTLLETLQLVDNSKPKPPKPKPLPGAQRSLDHLAKIVKRDPKEDPQAVVERNLAVLEEYRASCERGGGGGGGGKEEEEEPTTATTEAAAGAAGAAAAAAGAAAAATSPSAASEPHQTQQKQQQEARARLALRELSCVRGVDASLIAATGAGVALRAFRKSPAVDASLAVQASKILEGWKELVTSEVRARRKYRAHAASAAAAAAAATAPDASVS